MIDRLYNSTFTASRLAITKDGGGAVNRGQTAYATDQPCYLRSLNGKERDDLLKREIVGEYRLYCSASLAIKESDIITTQSEQYKVVFVAPRQQGNLSHQEVDLTRVEPVTTA